jgi:hypothetical protein
MSQFLTAQVQIEGSRPILWHAFGPDALGDGSGKRKEREGTAGNDPGEWRKTVLMTEDRQLFLKPTYVFGCLRDGAKYTSRKRGTLQGPLSSTLQVLDISGVKNPATRGRNVRYRVAASIGWKCGFSIMWDQTIISRGEMESVLNDAGKLCGLGDGRSIGYGRFNVLSFEAESA